PNLRSVRIREAGTVKTSRVCTSCLRSNKVTRAV
ncbi:MAG: 50S ribosomal protein L28, partial [Candidatus Eremiobacteraeota bacterium]|nr:50S ribosomal protein L28 [Candidatus Eremiobacteraeota bacterium]